MFLLLAHTSLERGDKQVPNVNLSEPISLANNQTSIQAIENLFATSLLTQASTAYKRQHHQKYKKRYFYSGQGGSVGA